MRAVVAKKEELAELRRRVAVLGGGLPPEAIPRNAPIALVLGNEEAGLAQPSLAACAARVTLPPGGPVESLNVSVAAAVLIHLLRIG